MCKHITGMLQKPNHNEDTSVHVNTLTDVKHLRNAGNEQQKLQRSRNYPLSRLSVCFYGSHLLPQINQNRTVIYRAWRTGDQSYFCCVLDAHCFFDDSRWVSVYLCVQCMSMSIIKLSLLLTLHSSHDYGKICAFVRLQEHVCDVNVHFCLHMYNLSYVCK